MSDPVVTTILVHGIVAALLALGGACCLYFGFVLLFRRKVTQSKSTFEAAFGEHKIAFSAGAAGTAVILASAVWVLGSVYALPSLSQTSTGTTVAAAIPFQGSDATLAQKQKELLDAIGPTLASGNVSLVIEGYADTGEGSDAMNQALAERRAQMVKQYLMDTYNPKGSITVVGHGESRPGAGIGENAVVVRSERVDR